MYFYIEVKYKYSILIVSLALIFSTSLYAQSENDISQYFDDGGVSESKNILKINLASALNGDISVHYERAVASNVSIEVGVGKLLPFYNFELPKLYESDFGIKDPDNGFSWSLQSKFYVWSQNTLEEGYAGFQISQRRYATTSTYTDLTMNYGVQLLLGKGFIVDLGIGIGGRFREVKDEAIKLREEDLREKQLIYPINIKTGFLF